MARIKDAELRVRGEGREAVFTLDVEIDWDRGDDDRQHQLLVRFKGADTGLRGDDDVLLVHSVPVSKADGDRRTVNLPSTDGVFDEDRAGDDEVYAEIEIHELLAEERIVRTNKVKGRF